MKRFLLSLFLLSLLSPLALAEKNTVILHPGDTVYVRFDVKGKKIRLAGTSKEKDDAAQVIFTFSSEVVAYSRQVKVENKFPQDLDYKLEMRSTKLNHQRRAKPTPVVGGKVAFDTYPMGVDELALFDFELVR